MWRMGIRDIKYTTLHGVKTIPVLAQPFDAK